jgi:hypothetical protein
MTRSSGAVTSVRVQKLNLVRESADVKRVWLVESRFGGIARPEVRLNGAVEVRVVSERSFVGLGRGR